MNAQDIILEGLSTPTDELVTLLANAIGKPTPEKLTYIIKTYQENSALKFYTIYRHAKPLACLGIAITSTQVFIQHIAVKKSERRQGLGRQLITYIVNYYKKSLLAFTDSEGLPFYQSLGFTITNAELLYGTQRFKAYLKLK